MQKIKIEWKHFDKKGKTCQRCSQTGRNLIQVLKDLKAEFASRDIQIELKETKLPENRMAESNSILIGGVPLENLILKAKAGENVCHSCSELTGQPDNCCCRTIEHEEKTFEEIPSNMIKQAILEKLQLKRVKSNLRKEKK
ncbi:DUF2703 domain-containing protein [Patescibacteria group bacterium]|nr:DUF2703 domain-containing protein [Patescibacteria group bacterium]